MHRYQAGGESIETVLPNIINHAITQLPIPKPMRWGSHTTEFARPVHWVTLLYGSQVIDTHDIRH